MDSLHVNGLEIAYRRAGSGPPLVLLHSAASDSREWSFQLAALADEFTVVAWDQPGAGGSSDLPSGFRLDDYASCLAGLIDELGLGSAHVAGLSWGGMVALELHRVAPRLTATLILADTYAGWRGSLPEPERRARVEGLRRALAEPGDVAASFPGLLAGEPSPQVDALLGEIAAAVRPEAVRGLLDLAELDQRDLLPRVAAPTLLLWGERDARSPLRVARQFEAAISGAKLVVIPGAGHLSQLERPDPFNQAVRDFCRAHPPG